MIGLLKGMVAAIGEDAALIEVNGVGYVAQAGARTLGRLAVGEAVTLYVETHVREDAIKLFGFLSEEERGWFVHLQSAPGVGAKVALAILDVLSPTELADAIALEDRAAIARANGVGPKLAARIVQEMAGKAAPRGFLSHGALAPAASSIARAANDGGGAGVRSEAVSALVNLGIDQASAARAVAAAAKTFKDEPPTGELIRAALRETSR
ncbi:MAG: Holliday junction branch migration protein RuvA [Hydrogenophilaceae bacterium]|jgi:Holliday junction DNA helicase RuvA|nr:Holliday junction branch migration protein RuvA [Hydrogenophilaceae bacterium]